MQLSTEAVSICSQNTLVYGFICSVHSGYHEEYPIVEDILKYCELDLVVILIIMPANVRQSLQTLP